MNVKMTLCAYWEANLNLKTKNQSVSFSIARFSSYHFWYLSYFFLNAFLSNQALLEYNIILVPFYFKSYCFHNHFSSQSNSYGLFLKLLYIIKKNRIWKGSIFFTKEVFLRSICLGKLMLYQNHKIESG